MSIKYVTYEEFGAKGDGVTDDFFPIKATHDYANQKGLTVKAISYKNDTPGDDIYLTLGMGENEYSFCIERYLTGPETEVYQTVATLAVGDVIDVTGFVYWYNGLNTHVTNIVVMSGEAAE